MFEADEIEGLKAKWPRIVAAMEAAEARATRAEALLEEAKEVLEEASDSLSSAYTETNDERFLDDKEAVRAFLDKMKGEG